MQTPRITRHHRTLLPRGMTATELVVAATLLASAIGILGPLAVRTDRVWKDARNQRLAVDELSNQLDRLRSLETNEREQALTELAPSEELGAALGEATLAGEVVKDQDGTRLILRLDWQRPGAAAPLELVAWLDAMPDEAEQP